MGTIWICLISCTYCVFQYCRRSDCRAKSFHLQHTYLKIIRKKLEILGEKTSEAPRSNRGGDDDDDEL